MVPLDIDGRTLALPAVAEVARHGRPVRLAPHARRAMEESARWVREVAEGGDLVVYGVNTGFGSLARVRIPPDQVRQLSRNLVRSHAAAVGPPAPVDVARAMVLLRANTLAWGSSGCRPLLVDHLLRLLDAGIAPVVPSQGSCGASGDLAPLAHLALILAHRPDDPEEETGEAYLADGRRVSGRAAMAAAGLAPVELGPKEGLALINGAQLSTAWAALACHDAERLLERAVVAAAMSIEALCGVRRAFHPAVHRRRPYPGARRVAARLLRLLEGSGWADSVPGKVQDAYALRCTPTVLGAAADTLDHVRGQLSVELNSVTDNPVICLEAEGEDKAFSAGLFHGEPVGIAADVLKIAVAEIASLSERRTYRLVTGNLSHRLPPVLRGADRPGVGAFGLQTTAAALVAENRARGWPASMDSIPTCEDQEDHVAMSTTAARRAAEVVANAGRVVDIELLVAARALVERRRQDPSRPLGRGTAAALAVLEGAWGPDDSPAEALDRLPALRERLLAAVEAA